MDHLNYLVLTELLFKVVSRPILAMIICLDVNESSPASVDDMCFMKIVHTCTHTYSAMMYANTVYHLSLGCP